MVPRSRSGCLSRRLHAHFLLLCLLPFLALPATARQGASMPPPVPGAGSNTGPVGPAGTPAAEVPSPWDVYITVFSQPNAVDQIGIVYDKTPPDATIREDIAALARELGAPLPKVEISREAGISGVKAELSGLTNWQTGTVNLDAIVRGYKRFDHFRVSCFFFGPFPLASTANIERGPIRVMTRAGGSSVDYEIWVDQSRGVPAVVPALKPGVEPADWRTTAGIVVSVILLLIGLGLIGYFGLRPRRQKDAEKGTF